MIEKKTDGIWVAEFKSIREFEQFITETPTNKVFENGCSLSSKDTDRWTTSFTMTKSFDEAIDLLHNGWTDKAKELAKRLKAVERDMAPIMKQQRCISVAGYQPIVPLFLAGQPASMVGTRMHPVKQKVVTLVKSISYSGGVEPEEWTKQGLKALAVVKKLEANGLRVNVDIVRGGYDPDSNSDGIACRVRVKNANERLNVSKLAFTMCHPSMQRRLMFRFTETYGKVTSGYRWTYGRTFTTSDWKKVLDQKKEFLLPSFINGDIDKVKDVADVERLGY